MKGITAFALNNSRTVFMTLLLVIVGGIYAFLDQKIIPYNFPLDILGRSASQLTSGPEMV